MALTTRQRQERYRDRKRTGGQQRHHVWLYPSEWIALQHHLRAIIASRSATLDRKTEETA